MSGRSHQRGSHPLGVPPDLPVPEDDGAASHLTSRSIPQVRLPSTNGESIDLAELASGSFVLFVFPKVGAPGEADPPGWMETPGAYGCTQQSCGFRDRHERFEELGYLVAGLSAQPRTEQLEAVGRLGLPYPLIADPDRQLGTALELPTFEIAGMTLYRRLTLVAERGLIRKVFYPVFPPGANADEVLAWITENGTASVRSP